MIATISELRLLACRGMTKEELEFNRYIRYELHGDRTRLAVDRIGGETNGHQRKELAEMDEARRLRSVASSDALRG